MMTLKDIDAVEPSDDGEIALAAPRIGDGRGRRRARAVVIGSGFGGLAAAVRLGARGYDVTVLERLDQPGGRARAHRIDGFTFDAGPTIVTAPHLLDELWALCGRRRADDVPLKALDPFYVIRYDDGETFTCCADPDRMRAEVARIAPGDVAGYERYMRVSREMYERGFVKMAEKPFFKFWNMVEMLPDLVRMRAERSVHSLAARHVRSERLRVGLSFHPLFVGGDPFTATAFYSMISHLERVGGVNFAMGGTAALVDGLVGLIEGQGGRLRYGADVDQILVEKGRATGVRLEGGETIAADIVVSNADSAWTYQRMLAPEARKRWTDKKLDRAAYSMGLFVWYFGTNRRYEDVAHHSIVLGPRYKGLLRDIFKHKRLAEDFSLYLHRPTATDPSLAPPGCDSFYALSPVPHLDAGVDWEAQAEDYRQRIEERLSETVLPGLGDAVVASKVTTPRDFRLDLKAVRGAAFGLAPILTQMAWFRPHNKSEDIERLYLVGAGAHPGAGLPGVLCSAKIVDKVIPDAAALV